MGSSGDNRPSAPTASITSNQDPHDPDRRLFLYYGDLTDGSQLARVTRTKEPDEIYNLAAQSHVAVSFDQPEYTGDVDGLGTVRLLEAIRDAGVPGRLYQAGTSEMFGGTPPLQSEDSSFDPRSPYAAAKLYAYLMTKNYREAYGLFAVTGIPFHHESPRRGETFVTRKVTRAVAPSWRDSRTRSTWGTWTPSGIGARSGLRRGDVDDAPAGRAD
jgi:GDPmannose 4,6-dehydratase